VSLALLFLNETSQPVGGASAAPPVLVEQIGVRHGDIRPGAGDFNMPNGVIVMLRGVLAWLRPVARIA
jgi:hypothetical protein